jgi:hypothetical protein
MFRASRMAMDISSIFQGFTSIAPAPKDWAAPENCKNDTLFPFQAILQTEKSLLHPDRYALIEVKKQWNKIASYLLLYSWALKKEWKWKCESTGTNLT